MSDVMDLDEFAVIVFLKDFNPLLSVEDSDWSLKYLNNTIQMLFHDKNIHGKTFTVLYKSATCKLKFSPVYLPHLWYKDINFMFSSHLDQ